MKSFDVIIVGGGPAGAAAAKILKDKNINFCVIEKEKFPRKKLCAGGLTNKSVVELKKLGLDISNIKSWECKEVQFVSKSVIKKMKLDNSTIMIDRAEFDNSNIRQVTDGNFFEEEKIINIENNILTTDKEIYEFKYIIFADGVNGYSRKLIDNRKFGFCVEYEASEKAEITVFDFTAIKNGYAWIFPKVDHTTIGLGEFKGNKDEYVNLLLEFAKKYNFEIDKSKIRGYQIPLFSKEIYKNSIIDNKYILVGDAASLADTLSGEGIYYALVSGKAAAESIVNNMKNGEDLRNNYFSKTNEIYKSLKKKDFLNKMLYSKKEDFLIKLGLNNNYFSKKINHLFG